LGAENNSCLSVVLVHTKSCSSIHANLLDQRIQTGSRHIGV